MQLFLRSSDLTCIVIYHASPGVIQKKRVRKKPLKKKGELKRSAFIDEIKRFPLVKTGRKP